MSEVSSSLKTVVELFASAKGVLGGLYITHVLPLARQSRCMGRSGAQPQRVPALVTHVRVLDQDGT